MKTPPFAKSSRARVLIQLAAGLILIVLSTAAFGEAPAQTRLVAPSTWWVLGPFPRYDQAMFETNEPMENASNNRQGANEWNRAIAVGGRELRMRQVGGAEPGLLNLASACGGSAQYACSYAGVRVRAEKADGNATATLSASGPVRWFFNNVLVAEGKENGVWKVTLPMKVGWNSLLAKSWNPTGSADWAVKCQMDSSTPLEWEPAVLAPTPAKPAAGRRNVALWSEGSRVAVSSIVWRGCAINERGLSMLNDGLKPGSPGGGGAAWNSHEVDGLPQWAWVRFPGMRTIDSVVIYCGGKERGPIDLAGEYSVDGGATFKTLFEIKDAKPNSKDASLRAEFPAVASDNVRIRITRAEKPSTSAFATAQLTEVEVYGDNTLGNGSMALVDAVQGLNASSELKPKGDFKPQINEQKTQVEFSTPWYRVALDRLRPRIAQLALDSLGKGEFKIALLRNAGAMTLVSPMFDPAPFPNDGALQIDGNVARYPTVTVAPGVTMAVALRFHEKSFELELSTASGRSLPLSGGVFRFDLDFWQTPTSFFGRATDPAHFVTLPCYIHAPDAGTFRVTQSGDGAIFRQAPSADDFNLSAMQLMDIAPWPQGSTSYGRIPTQTWRTTLRFDVESLQPFPGFVASEPRLKGLPRYALNIAQWMPGKKVLSNNVVSTNCPLSLQFYAEMGLYAPRLQDGLEVMDLVTASVDRYLDGLGGHLYWQGVKVEVTPPGKWHGSLETGGFMLNSAWYAVHTVGGKPLIERWLPRLEALAGHLEAHDTDGDGIVDSGDGGHWFDTYNLSAGVKEAHSSAVNYEAFMHLAELETSAGRKEQAAHYRQRAQLIKDNYLKVFFNPETGVIGGWRDKEGKLHDPIFPWVNGYAICAGLVDDKLANQILDRLFAQMKKIGFTQFQYGLPTNLIPLQADEWNHHGVRGWQEYMNGSITPPYSNYVIMALYKMGRREQAEELLWPQIASFDKGTFNSGVAIPYMRRRNPVGSAFYVWDGSRANGEGYLPENWHAYAGIFAGHFGIHFDETGYSLEPWSPLKGKRVPCGLPVMGKIQEFMQ